jgi:hypothetical protein
LSIELSAKRTAAWVEHAVLSIDRRLRRRYGIYEYSTHAECLFRIERAQADQTLMLSDGTQVWFGDPILKLHLWNEHMPPIGPNGPSVAWGRQARRAAENSLRLLASYVRQMNELDDVVAVRADMRLGPASKHPQIARIMGRFGFEAVAGDAPAKMGTLRTIGTNIMMFMLVLATNPVALRGSVLLRGPQRLFLSRAALERRHGGSRRAAAGLPAVGLRSGSPATI